MPDLSIETHVACPHWASNWDVEGSNGNRYLVQFHRGEPPTCSCPAYKYSGEYGEQHCKHIDKCFKHGCFYHPITGSQGANDWADRDETGAYLHDDIRLLSTAIDSIQERCTGCGAPGIVIKVAV